MSRMTTGCFIFCGWLLASCASAVARLEVSTVVAQYAAALDA